MMLTPEQEALGRRNFLKAVAGAPALVALGAAAAVRGPVRGGPVRVGFIGVGGQGRALLTQAAIGAVPTGYAEIRALSDINPDSLKRANDALGNNKHAPVKTYARWQEMLDKEDIEAVIMAPPLWAHADIAVGAMDAGKHVLCEKMMAWDIASCERMQQAALRNRRVLEIGYQRNYNPMYESAFEGIFRKGLLGDIYLSRILWHRNGNWRRQGQPPSPDYSAAEWGYPTFEHLLNWRLYHKYSRGLLAELCSHQINIVNQVYNAKPESVAASGGVYRFKEGGREAWDHVYATFDYPGGRTAVFSSVESNAFDDYYEMYMGTKGTLILRREVEAMLFEEGSAAQRTTLEITARGSGPVIDASETQAGNRSLGPLTEGGTDGRMVDRAESTRRQIRQFCSAIRVGAPLATGPAKAFDSARACILAHDAVVSKARVAI